MARINLKTLNELGYKEEQKGVYVKKVNDFLYKTIIVENKDTIKTRALRTTKLSIVHKEQIDDIINAYKELKEEYEQAKIKELITPSEKSFIKVLCNGMVSRATYIAVIKRENERYIRIRWDNSKLYSYIPINQGLNNLEIERNYTLKELGIND